MKFRLEICLLWLQFRGFCDEGCATFHYVSCQSWRSLHCCWTVWQWQPKLVQTMQQHCLVWISLDTQDIYLV